MPVHSDVKVSIVCLAYNQEAYIKDALEGFIAQETDFPFEVIVHDDASTDNTSQIIKQYAERFPDLITPILQKENQFGKGRRIIRDIVLPITHGDYIALCEGDDYWISKHKLQKQYDALAHYEECAICLHNSLVMDYGCNALYLSEPDSGDRSKSVEEIIVEGGGRKNPTASFFFKKEAYGCEVRGPVGDHFNLISMARFGGAIWLSEPMSVYRLMAHGSWSVRHEEVSSKARAKYHEQYISSLESLDAWTCGRYSKAFMEREDMHRQLLLGETIEAQFGAGEMGVIKLLKEAPSIKVVVKSILRRFASERVKKRIARLLVLISNWHLKTLISNDAAKIPDWASPLKLDES